MDRVRTYGLAGAGGIFVIVAVVVAIGTASRGELAPLELLPRGVAIGLLLLVGAVVALLGVRRRDRVLLAAAGFASFAPFWLSIATFPLVIPALLLLVASASAPRPERGARWLVAVAIVVLQVGSIAALLATTEMRCWLAYDSPSGLVYRRATEAETQGPMGGLGGPVGSGCDGGAVTELGVVLAAVLSLGGLAFALRADRRAATRDGSSATNSPLAERDNHERRDGSEDREQPG